MFSAVVRGLPLLVTYSFHQHNGVIVQLVRAPACHAGSCGFKSHLSRILFTLIFVMVLKLPFRPITYITIDYPDPSKINLVLYDLIKSNGVESVNGGAKRTDFSFVINNRGEEELDLLLSWIENLLPRIAFVFALGHGDLIMTLQYWGLIQKHL